MFSNTSINTSVKPISPFFPIEHPPVQLFPDSLRPCEDEIKKIILSRGLRILKKPIGAGFQGQIYALADIKTGNITNVLKVFRNPSPFIPILGAQCVANIKHAGICSPTQIFYRDKKSNTLFSRLPTHKFSECIAMIMPYVEGSNLKQQSRNISEHANFIFNFGLLLAEALNELTKNKVSHGDLHNENIIIDLNQKPVLIDFDFSSKTEFVSYCDYRAFRAHLSYLIESSPDINSAAKEFLLACLTKRNLMVPSEISKIPQEMISFMHACIDHLDEIRPRDNRRISKL